MPHSHAQLSCDLKGKGVKYIRGHVMLDMAEALSPDTPDETGSQDMDHCNSSEMTR